MIQYHVSLNNLSHVAPKDIFNDTKQLSRSQSTSE